MLVARACVGACVSHVTCACDNHVHDCYMLVTGVSCVPPPRARRTRTVAVPGAAAPPRRGAAAGAARAARADFRAAQKHTHNAGEGNGAPGGGGGAGALDAADRARANQSVCQDLHTCISHTVNHTHGVSISEAVACLYTSNEESGSCQLPGIAD